MANDVNGRLAERRAAWPAWACFVLMAAAILVVAGPQIRLSQWGVNANSNAGVAEGVAWLNGTCMLPRRMHDTALYNGHAYNVFPPLMGGLTFALAPLHRLLLDRADYWHPWTHLLLLYWPLPILGFLLFRRETHDPEWAGLLTLMWLGGTALLPNLRQAGQGQLGQTNHVLSQIGLMLIAWDVLGRRRIWPALLGLAIAVWSRQMTLLYAAPILWAAWRGAADHGMADSSALTTSGRVRRVAMVCVACGLVVAPLMILNYLKFGNPLDSGYGYIYLDRGEADEMGLRCAQYGVFSPRFIPENLWYMNVAWPDVTVDVASVSINPDAMGVSMWITTPLLLLLPLTARYWWRDRARRVLFLGTLPVIAGLLCYHSPGFMQFGYYRFGLDFIPIWLAIIAPWTRGGWRTWFTVGCCAWSLLYFQQICARLG